jgi:hypothetical protein
LPRPIGPRHSEISAAEVRFQHSIFAALRAKTRLRIAAGRGLADARDCAYLCDIAVLPSR